MAPYTKLAVRSLGPTKAVTLEQHAKIPTYVPKPPARGTRQHGLRVVASPEWKSQAACKDEPKALFYGPDEGDEPRSGPKTQQSNLAAKKVCARCAVQDECLAFALANREMWGVFGGLTAKERGKMLAARDALRLRR